MDYIDFAWRVKIMEHLEFDFDPINYLAIQVLEFLGHEVPPQNQIDFLENVFRQLPKNIKFHAISK